jgi:large subunit ribosomal protein L27
MATKKAGGSTQLGRDSISKRLGVKLYAGSLAKIGAIIIRQRGTKVHPGANTMRAGDDTIFATAQGKIRFQTRKTRRFDGSLKARTYVHVDTPSA